MNRRQQNSHAMHAAVLDLLDEHDALWSARTPVAAAVGQLRTAFERAKTLDAERRGLDTKGLTTRKAERRDAMEEAALRLVGALRPYARATGDAELLAEVDVTPSAFDRAEDDDAVGRAERVHVAATAHLADLADYGVTADDVTALRTAIDDFRPLGAGRDARGGQREARTASLPGAFAEARAALKLLDDLVPNVVRDATLTAEYRRVRRTDDR